MKDADVCKKGMRKVDGRCLNEMKIKGLAELDDAKNRGDRLYQFGDSNKVLIAPVDMWETKTTTRWFSNKEFAFIKKRYSLQKFYPFGGGW